MGALEDAAAAIFANVDLAVAVTWDAGDGSDPLTLRAVFAESPRSPKVRDRSQPHLGPTLRLTASFKETVTRDGRITVKGRVFQALQWDLSRDGATLLIELEEKGA